MSFRKNTSGCLHPQSKQEIVSTNEKRKIIRVKCHGCGTVISRPLKSLPREK